MRLSVSLLSVFAIAAFGSATATVADVQASAPVALTVVQPRVHLLPEADRDFARPALRGLSGVTAVVPSAVAVPSVIQPRLPPQITKHPTVVSVPVAPAKPKSAGVLPKATGSVLVWEAKIGWCESRDNYRDYNPSSGASGRYQFLKTTWNSNVKMYFASKYLGRAMDYPPAVQDAVFVKVFETEGTRPWAASRSCWENR